MGETVLMWEISVYPSQFYCKPKTTLKKIKSFKKRFKGKEGSLVGKRRGLCGIGTDIH